MKEKSLAMEMLEDYKKTNAIQFVIILVVLGLWALTIVYLVYTLNDIGSYDETITQETEDGINNYIGNDGDIYNGETDY